jgi:hypothetical protein
VCPKFDVAVVVVTLVQVCNFVSVCFIKMEAFSVKKRVGGDESHYETLRYKTVMQVCNSLDKFHECDTPKRWIYIYRGKYAVYGSVMWLCSVEYNH